MQSALLGTAIGSSMMLAQVTLQGNVVDGLGKLSASAILGVICWWLIRRDGETRKEISKQSTEYIDALESVVADNTKAVNGVERTVASVEHTIEMCHDKMKREREMK